MHDHGDEIAPGQPVGPDSRTDRSRAERRQLTVMFCDLVGSTALSGALDPEDLSDVLRAYQAACADIIARYDGSITRYMGDGIMVLFGYPTAHEDAAVRAVHAAVEIVAAIDELDRSGRFGPGVALAVRLGIATGLAVVGEVIGEGASREEAVVGETPNLAARLQALGEPNAIIISHDTRALIGERFECSSQGEQTLKGFSTPLAVWQVHGARDTLALMDAAETRDELPMVNREHERALLGRLWERSASGSGQIVVLEGEAGIGKSRLTRALRELIVGQRCAWLRLQCLPYYANTLLYPVTNRLTQLAGIVRTDSAAIKLDKLRRSFENLLPGDHEGALRALADALDIDVVEAGMSPGPQLSAERRKELMLATLSDLIVGMSRLRPVATVLEDAHWMDPTTGELLARVAERITDERVMIIVSHRPNTALALPKNVRPSRLSLGRLQPIEGRAILRGVLGGRDLDEDVMEAIVDRTDGVPLFVEELTRAMVDGRERVREGAVPISLKDSLMARVDGLGQDKPLAQLAAVIGQQFSRTLLFAVADRDHDALDEGVARLIDAGVLMEVGESESSARLVFRHALVRDAAYESQLRRRREAVHARVADTLANSFEDVASRRPELLAEHYTQAKRYPQAAMRWIEAGRHAAERSANREAVNHLERGRDVIRHIADSDERDRLELSLLNVLGPALIATDGAGSASVSAIYQRALALCDSLPESEQHFVARWGWWRVSMNHDVGRTRAEELQVLADRLADPGLLLQAHHCQWATAFHLGEHASCREHVERGLALYDEQAHRHQAAAYGGHDARVCGLGESALSLWIQGQEAQGSAPLADALAWARALDHVGSVAHAMDYAVIHALYRRDVEDVAHLARELRDFAAAQSLPEYVMRAAFFEGWSIAGSGDDAAGLAQMQRAVASLSEIGTHEDFPMFYELVSQVMSRLGRHQDAIRTLLAAFKESKQTGIRFWLCEQHRGRAELAMRSGAQDAEQAIEQALKVAARQGAPAFALRAAVTMARLYEHRRRRADALAVLDQYLSPYAGDDNGRDVRDARALRDQLSGP